MTENDLIVHEVRKAVINLLRLERSFPTLGSERTHFVISTIHDLCGALHRAIGAQVDASTIAEIASPAAAMAGRSKWVKRLQTWPRGYPGDFETVEIMLSGVSSLGEAPGSIEEAITNYSLVSPIVKQHTNKIAFQREVLASKMKASSSGRILSIACGGSLDLASIPSGIEPQGWEVVLVDADADALRLSEERLKTRGFEKITSLEENIIRRQRKVAQTGKFDVVVAGGILDYLNDRFASSLLNRCVDEYLNDRGILAFTSMNRPNPYDGWMKYVAGWEIVPRSVEDIVSLFSAEESQQVLAYKFDQTNLALLCSLDKA